MGHYQKTEICVATFQDSSMPNIHLQNTENRIWIMIINDYEKSEELFDWFSSVFWDYIPKENVQRSAAAFRLCAFVYQTISPAEIITTQY